MQKRKKPPVTEPREGLLDYTDAAEYLGISRRTLQLWVQLKRIEFVRFTAQVIRFRKAALDRFIARNTENVER